MAFEIFTRQKKVKNPRWGKQWGKQMGVFAKTATPSSDCGDKTVNWI